MPVASFNQTGSDQGPLGSVAVMKKLPPHLLAVVII